MAYFSAMKMILPAASGDVTITPEDVSAFVQAVLTGTAFTKVIQLQDLDVTFTSLSAKDYVLLSQSDQDFEDDYFILSVARVRGTTVQYEKPQGSLEEIRTAFLRTVGEGPLFSILWQYWFRFALTVRKLYEEAMNPDFFGSTPRRQE